MTLRRKSNRPDAISRVSKVIAIYNINNGSIVTNSYGELKLMVARSKSILNTYM